MVLTGMADEHLGEQAVRAGAQDYLVKGEVDGQDAVPGDQVRDGAAARWSEAQRQLHEAQVSAQENARLERGLLPSPVLADARLSVAARYRPGGKQRAARRGLLRRGGDGRTAGCTR